MRNPKNVLNNLVKHSNVSGYKFERLYRILFNEHKVPFLLLDSSFEGKVRVGRVNGFQVLLLYLLPKV